MFDRCNGPSRRGDRPAPLPFLRRARFRRGGGLAPAGASRRDDRPRQPAKAGRRRDIRDRRRPPGHRVRLQRLSRVHRQSAARTGRSEERLHRRAPRSIQRFRSRSARVPLPREVFPGLVVRTAIAQGRSDREHRLRSANRNGGPHDVVRDASRGLDLDVRTRALSRLGSRRPIQAERGPDGHGATGCHCRHPEKGGQPRRSGRELSAALTASAPRLDALAPALAG